MQLYTARTTGQEIAEPPKPLERYGKALIGDGSGVI